MRVLVIGGTRRTGPYLVKQLIEDGHSVVKFHRGQHSISLTDGAQEILGDRRDVPRFKSTMARLRFDVVVDMMATDEEDVRAVVDAFRGRIKRYVCISSYDVYAAYAAAWTSSPSLQTVPILEDAPKTTQADFYGREQRYDKMRVEREVAAAEAARAFETTILRWAALYGPRDTTPREWYYVKQALDRRRRIPVIDGGQSLFSRGYFENMAHSVLLAVESEAASGRVYNAADTQTMTTRQIITMIGDITGNAWEMVSVPRELMPTCQRSQGRPFSCDPYDIQPHLLLDLTKIRTELGYTDLVPCRPAMERTVEWLLSNPPSEGAPFDYRALDEATDKYRAFVSGLTQER
jgi:nucleoside-diphosphate-sugar epimerase